MELAGTGWALVDFETDRDVIPALVEAPAHSISHLIAGSVGGAVAIVILRAIA